jgi:hypothetical protein
MSKHYFEGIRDNSHKKSHFLKLKLDYQPNRKNNYTKFMVELLYVEVGEIKLSLIK